MLPHHNRSTLRLSCCDVQIGVKLQGIKSAQKQVVAGLNYKLQLETDDGLYHATVYSARSMCRLCTPILLCRVLMLSSHDPVYANPAATQC